MSEPSTPQRPEEVRDGAPGGDAAGGHEQPTPAENIPSTDAPTPPAPTESSPSEPSPDEPSSTEPSSVKPTAEPEVKAMVPAPGTEHALVPFAEPEAKAEVLAPETEPSVEPSAEPEAKAEPDEIPTPASVVRKAPRRERRPAAKVQRQMLTAEQKAEAREKVRERYFAAHPQDAESTGNALDFLLHGKDLVYLARFRRVETGGMDMRALRALRDHLLEVLREEERRVELREILRTHGALDEKTEQRLARASSIPAMEDIAAPHLPVVAGRATLARGLGLEPLADAIRQGEPGTVLSDLAKAYVKEGGEPASLDVALAGARDILAEEMCLDAELRARLRKLFRREAVVSVGLRTERRGDPGRHKSLVGFKAPASNVPPLKFLAVRRGERERVLVTSIEPPEERVLPLLHKSACAEDHPHAGFLRAAIEDGYRRVLKPLSQAGVRNELKARADAAAMETFERNLRHRLLAPVGGPRHVLGLRPDVMGGHRWCAIDSEGLPTGSGTLPHEGTAGREACLAELEQVLTTYEIKAIAVGSGPGHAPALSLAEEATGTHGGEIDVTVVSDGGTHALEAQGKLEIADRPEIPPECRGAFSLARRFQDPLRELVTIEPKALALGPHLNDVHQGRLRTALDESLSWCVAYVGVDPNDASEDLLTRVPGFHRQAARAFIAWREAHGPLAHKAALAAVPGVGTDVAEQAVGFLRLANAEDPRDRTQIHPSQYGMVDRMAEQVDTDVRTFFADGGLRSKTRLPDLETKDTPLPLLRYVFYQVAEGHLDERQVFGHPIPPPPGLTLETLQPGLVLEGRVVRALPFGVFVDVGLETDALIPTPHIGAHPGIEPATVAPIGAVVQARVLDVIPEKRRLTLTMRPDRAIFDRGRRHDTRSGQYERGGPRGQRDARRDSGARGPASGQGGRSPQGRSAQGRSAQGRGSGERGRPSRKPQHKSGKYGGTGGIGEIFDGRRRRTEPGVPRRISLGPDEGKPKEAEEGAGEKALTEEELLARKLADLKKKLEGDR